MSSSLSRGQAAIAWDALQDIASDIDAFFQRRHPAVTAQSLPALPSSDGTSTTAIVPGGGGSAASQQEAQSLRSEVDRLRRELEEAKRARPSPTATRKRSWEMIAGGGEGSASPSGPDERDLTIKRLTRQLEEEKVYRRTDSERHTLREAELNSELDKVHKQLAFLERQEKEAQTRLKKRDEDYGLESEHLHAEIGRLKRQVSQAQDALEMEKDKLISAKQGLSRLAYWEEDAKKTRQRLQEVEEANKRLNAELRDQRVMELEMESVKRQLEDECRRRQALEDAEKGRPDNVDTIVDLRQKLTAAEGAKQRLSAECASLRKARDETLVFKTTIKDLEDEVSRLRGRLQASSQSQALYESLLGEKRAFEDQLRPLLISPRRSTADAESGNDGSEEGVTAGRVLEAMRQLQDDITATWKDLTEQRDRNTELQRQISEARKEKRESSAKLARAEERIAQLETDVVTHAAHAASKDRENASLKKILDSYTEVVLRRSSSPAPTSAAASADEAKEGLDVKMDQDQQTENQLQTLQIAELQSQLAAAHAELAAMREKFENYAGPATVHALKEKLAALESASDKWETEVVELKQAKSAADYDLAKAKRELDRVEKELARLESDNAKGAKVLHMKDNPTTAALRAELKDLRMQNQILKDKLSEDGAAAVSAAAGDVSGMDESRYSARLKDMFKKRVAVYRDAVYQLTGYYVKLKSEVDENLKVEMRSAYADHPGDVLEFQWRDGQLQLLETAFIKEIPQRHFAILRMNRSNPLPAFLASITLDLFERQTIG